MKHSSCILPALKVAIIVLEAFKLCDVCQYLNYIYKVHFFAGCFDELVEIKNGLVKSVEQSDKCSR